MRSRGQQVIAALMQFSGISVELMETEDGYTVRKVTKDGKKVQDNDTFTVTCLATPQLDGLSEVCIFFEYNHDVFRCPGADAHEF